MHECCLPYAKFELMHKVEYEHGKEIESQLAEFGEHVLEDGVSWSMHDTAKVVHTCAFLQRHSQSTNDVLLCPVPTSPF